MKKICSLPIKQAIVSMIKKGPDLTKIKNLGLAINEETDNIDKIAQVAYMALTASKSDVGRVLSATTASDLSLMDDADTSPEVAKNQKKLTELTSIESVADMKALLMSAASSTTSSEVVDSLEKRTITQKVEAVETATLIDTMKAPMRTLTLDGKNVGLHTLKASRIEKLEGLKPKRDIQWGAFLDTYFPGLGQHGLAFKLFVEEHIQSSLLTLQPGHGFARDIDGKMNAFRDRVFNTSQAMKNMGIGDYSTVELQVALADEATKDKYFNDILSSDFDFIIQTVSGVIIADVKGDAARAKNTEVIGLLIPTDVDEVSNTSGISRLLDLSSLDVEEVAQMGVFRVDKSFDIVENMSGDPSQGGVVPTLAENTGVPKSFYIDEHTGNIFYIDSKEIHHNVTPRSAYGVNTKNNANSSSFDHSIDALDQDTEFIKNVFTLFRSIGIDGKFGPRMSYKDYLRIAPLLIDNKNNLIPYLKELADAKNGRLSTVARSLYYQVFSPLPITIEGETITSLASIVNQGEHDSATYSENNENIVKAMYVALTSKEQLRYLTVNNNTTRVAKKASDRDFSYMINDELGGRFLDGAVIKEDIAKHIEVIQGPNGDSINVTILNRVHNVKNIPFNMLPELARMLNMTDLFESVGDVITSKYGASSADASLQLSNMMKSTVAFIASNMNNPTYRLPKMMGDNKGESRGMFLHTAPTAVLLKFKEYLEDALQPDMTKQQTVAGEKRASSTPGNREAQIGHQIGMYDKFNKESNEVVTTFNAFVKSGLHPDIPHAEYGGAVIKTALVKDGVPLPVAQWPFKLRVEHALVEGFLKMPKKSEVGTKFFLQPIAYSDKQNIPMHEIDVKGINFLGVGNTVTEKLKTATIAYRTEKYESLQQISINKVKNFVGSNFNSLVDTINNTEDVEVSKGDVANILRVLQFPKVAALPAAGRLAVAFKGVAESTEITSFTVDRATRLDAIAVLRDVLVQKLYGQQGDMTKDINALLEIVGLPTDISINRHSEMDKEVDYITNLGGKFLMKPTAGVRAGMYRANPMGMLDRNLSEFRKNIEHAKVDKEKILVAVGQASIGSSTTLETNADTLLDRMFMINEIYGNSLKVLTMGDESYFDTKTYGKFSNSADYYAKAEANPKITESDSAEMMIKQSKRAQSALTRGQVYMSKGTLVGLKRNAPKGNILNHLEVQSRKDGKAFSFPDLVGKDMFELEAMGIIERINGSILSSDGGVMVNVGREKILLNDTLKRRMLQGREYGEAMYSIISDAVMRGKTSQLHDLTRYYDPDMSYTTGPTARVDGRPYLEYGQISNRIDEMHADRLITLPDFIPNIVVSDPVSRVDLLQKMNAFQENSDAIQYTHPVYDLLFKAARGGKLSGFYSDKAVATKTLTTTFEYDSFRQVLQKKSNQMPFSFEQMSKFGGTEMFAALEKMSSAIPFINTWMTVPPVDADGDVVDGPKVQASIKNMHELFEYFGGFKRGNDTVWDDVVKSLVDNAENMFSFYGVMTVPSNQKTGHKNINKWEDVFSTSTSSIVPSYMAQEYNMEVLSKDHEYDVTEGAAHKSQLTLLSQLVNAVGFGGMSSVESLNLQNAMETMSDIDNHRISNMLADTARDLIKDGDLDGDPAGYTAIEAELRKGIMGSSAAMQYKVEFEQILAVGMYDIIQKAFNEDLDSPLIKDLLGSSRASLDTPSISARVMGVIRSNLFKQIVQVKMSGFIGVVSAAHNTINIHTVAETGARVSRKGFVDHYLTNGGSQLITSTLNIDKFNAYKVSLVPTDSIRVNGELTTMAHVDLDAELASGSEIDIVAIPFKISKIASTEQFDNLPDNAQITVKSLDGGRDVTGHKWYIKERATRGDFNGGTDPLKTFYKKFIQVHGAVSHDTTEENSLRWYIISSADGTDISTTKAYRDLYRFTQEENPGDTRSQAKEYEAKLADKNAALITETQRMDSDGEKVWNIEAPEVVLPTFSAKAYGVKEGTALHLIIGTDGNIEANALSYFSNQDVRSFKLETGESLNRLQLLAKYTHKLATTDVTEFSITASMYEDIIITLKSSEDTHIGVSTINSIVNSHKLRFDERRAKSFVEMLKVTLTRIPGQTKQSGFAANVVEFLDAQGNATFAPTEHLINTGGDFDVDTLSVLTKTLDKHGFVNSYKRFTDDAGVINNKSVLDHYNTKLSEIETTITSMVKEHNELVEGRRDEILINVGRRHARLATLDGQRGTDKYNDTTYLTIERKLEKDQAQLLSLDRRFIDDGFEQKLKDRSASKLYDNMMNMMSNALEDGVRSSLLDVNTASEVQTPISMSMFRGIINNIKEAKARNGSSELDAYASDEFPTHGESFLSNLNIENLNAQGRNAIGVIATSLKMSSAVHVAQYAFDHTKQVAKRDPFVFTSEVSYESAFEGGQRVITRNNFVDLDRFSIMRMVANNKDIQSALLRVRNAVDSTGVAQADVDMLKDIIGEAVYNVVEELDKGTTLTLGQINKIARAKINSLFGVDMYDVTAKESNITLDGKELASEFIDC